MLSIPGSYISKNFSFAENPRRKYKQNLSARKTRTPLAREIGAFSALGALNAFRGETTK
jgi:hypothetical protein